jgi:hypothetical protein
VAEGPEAAKAEWEAVVAAAKAAEDPEAAKAEWEAVVAAAKAAETTGLVVVEAETTGLVVVEVETTGLAEEWEAGVLEEAGKVLVLEGVAKQVAATASNLPKLDLGRLRTLNL